MKLKQLPYHSCELEPYISELNLSAHFGQHYKNCLSNLQTLVSDTVLEYTELTDLIKISTGAVQFNAIQVWNHTFFFNGLKPGGAALRNGALKFAINGCFGSAAYLKESFVKYAVQHSGPGWIWLVVNPDGTLELVRDHGSRNPLLKGFWPLFNCDLWDHAYAIDYGSDRGLYAESILKIINWEIVEKRYNTLPAILKSIHQPTEIEVLTS